jgi:hypothetical protein
MIAGLVARGVPYPVDLAAEMGDIAFKGLRPVVRRIVMTARGLRSTRWQLWTICVPQPLRWAGQFIE